jgi:YD repeat-containing protein
MAHPPIWPHLTFESKSCLGDLLKLIDPKQRNTRWAYDHFGQVTNKTDPLGAVMFAYGFS